MDYIRKSSQWLSRKRRKHTTFQVVYRRGNVYAIVPAQLGKSRFEVTTGDGAAISSQARNYIIDVSDLVIDGVWINPQRGDMIEEQSDDRMLTCEVAAPGLGHPEWEYADDLRTRYRIHVKVTGG